MDFHEYMLFDSHWILSDELFTKKASIFPEALQRTTGCIRSAGVGTLYRRARSSEGGSRPHHTDGGEQHTGVPDGRLHAPCERVEVPCGFHLRGRITEKDQANFWKQVGKKRNGQLESFIGKRKAMEQAVAQIVSPNDSQDVKLRKIYDRVQQIRNKSYEVQKTEQEQKRAKEKSVENVNVEDIWKRGYGNSVQLTWLFLGLARAAGFEAYGCWVSDRKQYFFTPVTMQSAKLNANVVLVKLNGKDVYFDPGAAFTPFGLLTWAETGVEGLRLDKDGGTWIRTTLPQPSESRIERVGKLQLSDTGDLEGKLTVTYTGLEAMYQRLEERNADEVARKKFMEELVTSQISAASQADLSNQPDWTSSETPLVAEFNLKIPGWASNAGKRAVVPAAIFTAAEKGIFEHVNRVQPIYFEYPHEKADDLTVELPPGWQVSSVPSPQNRDAHVIRYTLNVEKSPGTLHLTRRLTIDLLLLEQKYYSALRNFFQVVRTGDGEQIVLQPGEIHASN